MWLSLLEFGPFYPQLPVSKVLCVHCRFTRGLKHKPKRLPLSFWGWLIPVYKTTEEDLLKIAGFDAAVYMRIISFGEWLLDCSFDRTSKAIMLYLDLNHLLPLQALSFSSI